MKQYIFSALCLVSGAFCLSSCNDDKEARPYTPDYEIVPEYTNADTWKAVSYTHLTLPTKLEV